MQCPNTDANGQRVAVAPPLAQGGWRGVAGHAQILKVLERTRFRLDPRIASAELWLAYWLLQSTGPVPLVCRVCGQIPEKATLSNLLSGNKSQARCACTTRPRHGTLAGRQRLADALAARGYELALSEAEWEEAHLLPGEAWRFVALRCAGQCKGTRHVVVARGASAYTSLARCACARPAPSSAPKRRKRARTTTAPPAPSDASEDAETADAADSESA